MKENKKKPLLFRLIVKIVKIFYRKRIFIGTENLPSSKAVVVGNHAQLHGPLTSQLYFPTNKKIWCIGEMMNKKEVQKYAYKDFWSLKPKWIRWFFKIVSYLIVPIAPFFFNNADTIAVYKDRRIVKTFKTTINEIQNDNNIIIFPECSNEYNEIVNEFQVGFIDVARIYYEKYNALLEFVPMYNAPRLKKVVFGKPIKYNPDLNIDEQKIIISAYLKDEITKMAKELPKHKVVCYSNVGRKKYVYSKD